jgi:hypothetical protein
MLIDALTVGWAASSQAERTIDQGLEVAFNGNFAPHDLPRTHPAPVKIQIQGRIATTDGSHPPPLRWLELEIHRNGKLSGEGLPVCRSSTLQSTSTQTAVDRCGRSLVGRGSFHADVDLGRDVFANGKILAFRSRRQGKEVLLMHLFAAIPVRFTLIVPLVIGHKRNGQFGTVLRAHIPRIGGIVSVTQIELKIGRTYSFRGERHSYVSAACSAPPGFSGAPFTFASGNFRFEDRKPIRITLVRSCSVR